MKSQKTHRHKWIVVLVIVISLGMSVNLAISSWNLRNRQNVVSEADSELRQLIVEKDALTQELEYVRSKEYVEKEARDKLGLGRDGETVIVIGNDSATSSSVKNDKQRDSKTSTTEDLSWFERILQVFLRR